MRDDGLAELDTIVRRHYDTGEYADTHLLMAPSLWETVRTRREVPRQRTAWSPVDPFALLRQIPIVLDDELAPGEWRLVDRTGQIVKQGTVPGV